MARRKDHDRYWAILHLIEEGRPIEELVPAATEEEMKFYRLEKWDYEETLKLLPEGAPRPHFVPPSDTELEW